MADNEPARRDEKGWQQFLSKGMYNGGHGNFWRAKSPDFS